MQLLNGIRLFWIIFFVVLAAVAGGIAAIVVSMVRQKRRNDRSPRVAVAAIVTEKHTDTTTQHHPIAGDVSGGHGYHTISSTVCRVRFRTGTEEDLEFTVDEDEFARISEGDRGTLTFQGTRYLGFRKD